MKTVSAAIAIQNHYILITRRAPGEKLAGYWEFPGGKLEDGESLQECLERELLEELGVTAKAGPVICESIYEYDHGCIKLVGLETKLPIDGYQLTVHDSAQWIAMSHILDYQLAPADIPIAMYIQETYCQSGYGRDQ